MSTCIKERFRTKHRFFYLTNQLGYVGCSTSFVYDSSDPNVTINLTVGGVTCGLIKKHVTGPFGETIAELSDPINWSQRSSRA